VEDSGERTGLLFDYLVTLVKSFIEQAFEVKERETAFKMIRMRKKFFFIQGPML
jgi:hypothetical protein